MSEPKKPKSLTKWDWTTLVASWRYYEHGHTIASAMFPGEIVERFFSGEYDRESCFDIARQFAYVDHGIRGYGDWPERNAGLDSLDTDRKVWCKFLSFCRAWCDGFTMLTVNNGKREEKMEAFWCEINKRWYPKREYVENPNVEMYIPSGSIVKEAKADEG